MDKIRKLEQRWYKYRIKKIGSSLFILSLFPFVIMMGYYIGLNFDNLEKMLFSDKVTQHHQEPIRVVPKVVEESKPTTTMATPLAVKPVKEQQLVLEPIIPIIDMEREEAKRYRPAPSHSKKVASRGVRAKPNTYLTAQELSKGKSHLRDTTQLKKIHLHSSSKDYIKMMKEKFSNSKEPREALLLAEAFYRKGDYKKAEKWALTANRIDSNLDESWILFAQSKAKMAQKDEAISILVAYYRKTKSDKVKRAIEKIKRGKI